MILQLFLLFMAKILSFSKNFSQVIFKTSQLLQKVRLYRTYRNGFDSEKLISIEIQLIKLNGQKLIILHHGAMLKGTNRQKSYEVKWLIWRKHAKGWRIVSHKAILLHTIGLVPFAFKTPFCLIVTYAGWIFILSGQNCCPELVWNKSRSV